MNRPGIFYHRMARRVVHADTREMFEYLTKEAEENKARLHQCLTPEGCPVVPPVQDLHLPEQLKVPEVTEGLSSKEARAELSHKDKLENIYDTVAFPEVW